MTEHTVRPSPAEPPAAPAARAGSAAASPRAALAQPAGSGRLAGSAASADERGWSLVLPLKPLSAAKSRLAPHAGPRRPEFALAFALDTVAAALACPLVERVLVVTVDPVAGARLAALGAAVLADEPAGGLNAALAHGAERAARLAPGGRVAVLSADLPALRPAELGQVLTAAAAEGGRCFLADTPGSGTTLLATPPGHSLSPAFGPGSRARHAASGARELTLPAPTVRRDVDTHADLTEAHSLGLGPHTSALTTALV